MSYKNRGNMIKDFFELKSKEREVETRISEEDYIEAVILVTQYPDWKNDLMEFLGGPLKDAGIKPSPEHTNLTNAYGGIKADQVLFASEIEGKSIVAMLWPWQDGKHITLKLKEIF